MKTQEELNAPKGEADNSCPKNLEKMDADCVNPRFYVCPYAHGKQKKYVCSLGKGECTSSFFVEKLSLNTPNKRRGAQRGESESLPLTGR